MKIDNDIEIAPKATIELLCFACNAGIGHFKDDPKVIARAAEYCK